MAGRDIVITDQGSVVFKEEEANGLNSVSLKGPSADITSNYNIKLPSAKPSGSGQMLNADVSGSDVTLSFAATANVGMAGINVLAHGAEGDGSDDDFSEFEAAITASQTAGQNSTNERIIVPAGTYILSHVDGFSASHSYWIEGAGIGATTLKQKAAESDNMIAAVGVRMLVFRHMTIDGNSLANIMLQANAPYVFIDNVEFTNCSKAIKVTGSPKVVSITNCRFTDMEQGDVGPMVDLTSLANADGCDVIFNDNYLKGATPASAGVGTKGIEVSTSALDRSARCFIRGNNFNELGKAAQGAIKITGGHDSLIEGNTFVNIVGTPVHILDSKRVRVAGNRISSESAEIEESLEVAGIKIEASSAPATDVEVCNNVIVGTAHVDVGIKVLGGSITNLIQDVVISNNNIDGCIASIVADEVKGKVDISNNSIRNSLPGTITTYKLSAIYIGNIPGDAHLSVSGNVFTGGASSGRAIHFDRSATNHDTAGDVHLVLRDNSVNSMAQSSGYNLTAAGGDAALIYINGDDSDPAKEVLRTVHASGNRYDFTSSQAIAYGMHVNLVEDSCTFDSILEFGAVPDSSTDSTVAINRAGLAAGAGGEIHVPRGLFRVSDWGTKGDASTPETGGATHTCIEVTASGQLWWGPGRIKDVSVDESSASNDTVLSVGHDGTTVRGITFQNAHATANTGKAIAVGNHSPFTVEDCQIEAFEVGIEVGSDNSKISGCHILNTASTGAGISVISSSSESSIIGNTVASDTDAGTLDIGILVAGAKNINIVGNCIRNPGGDGIKVSSSAAEVSIQGNTFNLGSTAKDRNAIFVDTCTGVTISGNTVLGASDYGANRQDIRLKGLTYGSVTGNTLTSMQIKLETTGTSNFISIGDNCLRNNDGTPKDAANPIILGAATSACSVSGNTLIQEGTPSSGSKGLYLAGDDTVVTSNVFKGFNKGVDIPAGAANNVIGLNRYMSGITDAIVDAGTDTTVMDTTTLGGGTSFSNLQGTILRAGQGTGGTALTASGEMISVTESHHHWISSGAAADLEIIKIDGKHTLIEGSESEAAACSVYDGMLLTLLLTGSDEAHVTPLGSSGVGSGGGRNIKANHTNVPGSGDPYHISPDDSITLRFEYNHSTNEGYWWIISHVTGA